MQAAWRNSIDSMPTGAAEHDNYCTAFKLQQSQAASDRQPCSTITTPGLVARVRAQARPYVVTHIKLLDAILEPNTTVP